MRPWHLLRGPLIKKSPLKRYYYLLECAQMYLDRWIPNFWKDLPCIYTYTAYVCVCMYVCMYIFLMEKDPQQMLRTHRSLDAYSATL